MLVLHLRHMGEGSLASQAYRQQVEKGWPGLAREAKSICENLGIADCNITILNQKEFKRVLKDALKKKDEAMLREQASSKKKCDGIMKDGYGKKVYMSKEKMADVRVQFKSKTRMLPFGDNFHNDRRFYSTSWMCRCKLESESEGHIKDGQCRLW